MPKKKSARNSAENFIKSLAEIADFSEEIYEADLSKLHESWCYEYAVIRLYRDFERLMLNCVVAAINNDTSLLSDKKGFNFPKHLTDEVCEYIVVGDGYFDFRGRSGLISLLKRYLPDDHYLVAIVKDSRYRDTLDQLTAFRNFAAHASKPSKDALLKATGLTKVGSAGSCLKANDGRRFGKLVEDLKKLAEKIKRDAPY